MRYRVILDMSDAAREQMERAIGKFGMGLLGDELLHGELFAWLTPLGVEVVDVEEEKDNA